MNPEEPLQNPFPGLRPFEENDNLVFFGRDEQIEELLERLGRRRFVAVIGTSASGKSSLVRAGLVPALRGGFMVGASSRWRIAVMRPGSSPLSSLAGALATAGVLGSDEGSKQLHVALARAVLERGELGLVEVVAQAELRGDENVLIVVDQFEELFRFEHDADEAAAFVKLLLAGAAHPASSIFVLLTMRSDFLGDCARFRELPETINDGLFLVPRMTRDQLREAIEGPIGVAEAAISPLLVNRLLNELGDSQDQLPVLQHALLRTWDAWSKRGSEQTIDATDFDETGGLAYALSKHCDEVYDALAFDERVAAERIFKALTVRGSDNRDVRRPTPLGDLPDIGKIAERDASYVVAEFRADGRSFLMPPSDVEATPATVIDISHESLMRVWTRLATWVEEEADSARAYRRLAEAAQLHEEGEAALLSDPALSLAVTWRSKNAPTAAWAERYAPGFATAMRYLDLSIDEQRRQKRASEERERLEREAERRRFEIEETAKRERAQREVELARARAEASERLARRTRGYLVVTSAIALLAIALGAVSLVVRNHSLEVQSRFLARDSETAVESGDAVTGMLLALEALPSRLGNPFDRPYVVQAEDALANAVNAQQERMDLLGHAGPAYSAAFSPDGRRIVGAFDDATLHTWDAATGAQLEVLSGCHTLPVNSATFSPDGRRIVSASDDGKVCIWDAAGGKVLNVLRGHGGPVYSAEFSPDQRLIISASHDDTVRLWNTADGAEVRKFNVIGPTYAAFSPDGLRIVVTSVNAAKVLDLRTGAQVRWLRGQSGNFLNSAVFSPDGNTIATSSGDGTARLWNVATGAVLVLRGHTDLVLSAAFSPDGRRVVSASNDQTIRVWDARPASAEVGLFRSDTSQGFNAAKFSPDGRRIVAASDMAYVWDAMRGAKPTALIGYRGNVFSVAFSPDGRRVAGGSGDHMVRLWDAGGRIRPLVLSGHTGVVNSVAFSPDGKRIVSASSDRTARIWDAGSGALLKVLRGHRDSVTCAAFSPDGERIVTASDDQTIRLWDTASGNELMKIAGHSDVFSAAFSPDGRRIVSGSTDDTARVWDASDGGPLGVLRGHSSTVDSAAYSPDGRRIVTASYDHTVREWDAATGAQLAVFRGQSSAVNSADFSPSGESIVSASDDGTVRLWRVPTLQGQSLIDAARSRLPRELTEEQREDEFLTSASR